MIQARFKCQFTQDHGGYDMVQLSPVYSDDVTDPNYTWSKATPSGSLTMTITNPAARGVFKPGKTYDLIFSEVG